MMPGKHDVAHAALVLSKASPLLMGLMLGVALLGCAGQESSAAQGGQAQTASMASDDDIPAVLATVGDEKITMEDVRARSGDELAALETGYQRARHKLIQTALDQILAEKVLMAEAQKEGKSVDELVAAEAGGSLEPSDVEIAAWYKENPSRVGGRSLEQVHDAIADYLRQQRRQEATEKLQERLNAERKVTVNLQPYRLKFDNADAPVRGPSDAPVTLVEFSDFQCPFCGRFFPTLKKVEEDFGDTVRVVYRQYPLTNIHPYAQKAAEASLCAKEQGKFWEMHDLMFQEQSKLTVADLKEKAGRLALDQKKFDECLDSGRYVQQVEEDLKEGQRVGVTGTPAIFVNGVPVEGGAVPYDVIAKAIREQLRGEAP